MHPTRTAVALALSFVAAGAYGQRPAAERELGTERERISSERVTRQVEIERLERMIERLQERVTLLERRLFGATQYPAITLTEAEALLHYAEQQLQESQQRQAKGTVPQSRVAADRLAVVRAEAQLKLARTAHADRTALLRIEVIDAERRLVEETQKLDQVKQLLAKGFGTKEGLRMQQLNVDRAQQELERARAKRDLQKRTTGDSAKAGHHGDTD